MGSGRFSIGEAVKFGWRTTIKNVWFLAGLMVLLWIVSIISQSISKAVSGNISLVIMVWIISFVVDSILTLGTIKIMLKFHDNQKPSFIDLVSCYRLALNYIGAVILFWIISAVGLLLLIIPGIIAMLRLQFFGYFIVDKNKGPVEALKASWESTRGSCLNLLLLWLTFVGVVICGALALLVGLLVAIPLALLAMTFVYRRLSAA